VRLSQTITYPDIDVVYKILCAGKGVAKFRCASQQLGSADHMMSSYGLVIRIITFRNKCSESGKLKQKEEKGTFML
jgi:hypothetical protein